MESFVDRIFINPFFFLFNYSNAIFYYWLYNMDFYFYFTILFYIILIWMNLFGNMRHRFNYCKSEFTIQFWKRFKDSLVSLFVNFYTHKVKELFIAHNWNFIQYLCMLFKLTNNKKEKQITWNSKTKFTWEIYFEYVII